MVSNLAYTFLGVVLKNKMRFLLGLLLLGVAFARPDVSHLTHHLPTQGTVEIKEHRYELPGQYHHDLHHVGGQTYGVQSLVGGAGGQHLLSNQHLHGVHSLSDQHLHGVHSLSDQHLHGVHSLSDQHLHGVHSLSGQHLQGVHSLGDHHLHGVHSLSDHHLQGVGVHAASGEHLHGVGVHTLGSEHLRGYGLQSHGDQHLQGVGGYSVVSERPTVAVKSVITERREESPLTEVRYELPSTSYGVPLTDKYGQVNIHSNFPTNLQSPYYTTSDANIYGKNYYDAGKYEEEKHVYYFTAPDAIEERPRLRIHLTPYHKKNTNVVFVKVPEYANPIPEVIAPPSEIEDKTKVYVLLKGNKDNEPVVYTAPTPVKSVKPEVFVYKYKNQQDLQQVLAGGREGQSVGTGVYSHNDEESFVRSLAESRAAFLHNDKYSGFAPRSGEIGHFATVHTSPVVGHTVVTKEETIPSVGISSLRTVPVEHHHVIPSGAGISGIRTYEHTAPVVNEQVVRTFVTKDQVVPSHNVGGFSTVKTFNTENIVPVVHQQIVPSNVGLSSYRTYSTAAPVLNEQLTRTVVTKEETIPSHFGVSSSEHLVPVVHHQVLPSTAGVSAYKTYSTQTSEPVVNEVTRTVVTKDVPSHLVHEGLSSLSTPVVGQVTRTVVTKGDVPSTFGQGGIAVHSYNSKRSAKAQFEDKVTQTLPALVTPPTPKKN